LFSSFEERSALPVCFEKALHVLDRAGVGRDDLQHLAGLETVERFLRLENGQRTRQPARIEFLIEFHFAILREYWQPSIGHYRPFSPSLAQDRVRLGPTGA
jgi:hypothetical protein